jgi:large subunit ribosomal protein L7/L12
MRHSDARSRHLARPQPPSARRRIGRWVLLAIISVPLVFVAGCGDSSSKPAALPDAAAGPEVWLISVGDRKISTIQAVREITGLGLADAKALVERAPTLVKKASDDAEALVLERKLRDAGAMVEVRGRRTSR